MNVCNVLEIVLIRSLNSFGLGPCPFQMTCKGQGVFTPIDAQDRLKGKEIKLRASLKPCGLGPSFCWDDSLLRRKWGWIECQKVLSVWLLQCLEGSETENHWSPNTDTDQLLLSGKHLLLSEGLLVMPIYEKVEPQNISWSLVICKEDTAFLIARDIIQGSVSHWCQQSVPGSIFGCGLFVLWK